MSQYTGDLIEDLRDLRSRMIRDLPRVEAALEALTGEPVEPATTTVTRLPDAGRPRVRESRNPIPVDDVLAKLSEMVIASTTEIARAMDASEVMIFARLRDLERQGDVERGVRGYWQVTEAGQRNWLAFRARETT